MNLWREAPWRGIYQCEAPFRFQQLENYQRRSPQQKHLGINLTPIR